jgi:hypothetical protein
MPFVTSERRGAGLVVALTADETQFKTNRSGGKGHRTQAEAPTRAYQPQ